MQVPQTTADTWLRQEAQALGESLKERTLDKALRKEARGLLRQVWEWEQDPDRDPARTQALLEALEALQAPAQRAQRGRWADALRGRLLAQWPLRLRCTREGNWALPCVDRAVALHEHRQGRVEALWALLEPSTAAEARTVNYRSSNTEFTVVEKHGSS